MTKTKRKKNKNRKQHKHVDDVVVEAFKGLALHYKDILKLQREGENMCGYLRDVHRSGSSYHGHCALTGNACNYNHTHYDYKCQPYIDRFGGREE